jgi:hypothetical protein
MDDPLHASDVEQIEGQSAATGSVHPLSAVLVGQAQQLLRLAELGPGEVTGEQLAGEMADVHAARAGLANQAFGIAQGVGGKLLGVVAVICAATTWGLGGMGLDELAPAVDAHQGPIPAGGDRPAQVAMRGRVQGLEELDMVVGMNNALSPGGGIEALADDRLQGSLLDLFENRQRTLAGRAMQAGAGGAQTPTDHLALDVVAVAPLFASEERVPHVGYVALDLRLRRWHGDRCGIDDEAAVGSILRKRALKERIVAIGACDGVAHVVEHDAGNDAAKELPGILETLDHIGDLHGVGGVHVLVTAVAERDDQGPELAAAVGLAIGHESQVAEVDLGQLPGGGFDHAHCGAPAAEVAVERGEPVQGAVGHEHALALQERLDLRQAQRALLTGFTGQPGPDLLAVLQQPALALPGSRMLRPRTQACQHAYGQSLVGLALWCPTFCYCVG